jgi:uncharacterized DUF497 family protein
MVMQVSFDPSKNEANIRDRQLPFVLVEQLDWAGAFVVEDTRKDYGERRKANAREVKHYEKAPNP